MSANTGRRQASETQSSVAAAVGPLPRAESVIWRKAAVENFPVASRVLPAAPRRHLVALYGFARLVDDIGDEGEATPAQRLAELGWVEEELERAIAGRADHPVLRRLGVTIRACRLEHQPFVDLIAANRQDQRVLRYENWDDLLAYCRLSANPVGRLVMQVLGIDSPARRVLSDEVCTGLQLTEHWQDIGEDARRGRVYVPADDLVAFGCTDADLVASASSPQLRRLIAAEVERTRPRLDAGIALVSGLRGRPRWAVAAFAAGGHAALDSIERAGCDVLAIRARPSRRRMATRLVRVLVGARRFEAPGADGPRTSP